VSLYRTLLNARFDDLPDSVRAFHEPHGVSVWEGTAQIKRGSSVLASLICAVFRFPRPGEAVPTRLKITPRKDSEVWIRNFDGSQMSSTQVVRNGFLVEQLGPIRVHMRPVVEDASFSVVPEKWSLLNVPLPRILMPTSENFETEANGKFCFDVTVSAPFIGLLVSYRGQLQKKTGEQ